MAAVTCELQWLQYLFFYVHIPYQTTFLYYYNLLVIRIAKNHIFHERTKYIKIDCHIIIQKIADGFVHLLSVPSSHQLADYFIKALPASSFKTSLSNMGIQNLYTPS